MVVPYRGDNGGHRDAALAYVEAWWGQHHPGWQFVCGYQVDGPWCKAAAVDAGLRDATGDILIIADGDVITEGITYAVEAVIAGAPWCVPFQRVLRLTAAATGAVLAGGPLPYVSWRGPNPEIEESYTGLIGGGMVVLPRAVYDRIPLDPRFVGWGLEDASWALALGQLAGPPPRRGPADLWHLWHPPQLRMSRAIGSPESLALYERYLAAARNRTMSALLAEMSDTVP